MYTVYPPTVYTRLNSRNTYEGSMRPIVLSNLIPDGTTLPNEAARKAGRPREKRYRVDNTNTRIRKDSRRKGDTAAARSTRKAKKQKRQDDIEAAASVARIQNRKDTFALSDRVRALCDTSDEESTPKNTAKSTTQPTKSATNSTPKSTSTRSKSAAKAAAPIAISDDDEQSSDDDDDAEPLPSTSTAANITFVSRAEAEAVVTSDEYAIAEAAELYLNRGDPDAGDDQDEAESQPVSSGWLLTPFGSTTAATQESLRLTPRQKRSAEPSSVEPPIPKRIRGPCGICRDPNHAFLACPKR